MIIDRIINKHLRDYERTLPRRERIQRWHWERVVHDATPVLWCMSHLWWIPGFRWLWRLRCRNVNWRLGRYIKRVTEGPELYNWAGGPA